MNPNSCRFWGQKGVVILFAVMAFILALFVPPVPAEEQSNKGNEWEFKVAPYMWFLGDGPIFGHFVGFR